MRSENRRLSFLFILVCVLFLLKSLFYVSITPLWEGFDELFHFAYVQSLASSHHLPVWGSTYVDSTIAESSAYVPLPESMPPLVSGVERMSYRDYWTLGDTSRAELQESLRRIRLSASQSDPSNVPLYQVQHPPLYYLICVPVIKMMDGRSLVDAVFALRTFSILLTLPCILAAWLIARKSGPKVGLMLVATVALWPCFYTDIARVGNDSLSAAILSLIFCFAVSYADNPSTKRAAAVGLFLGLGLLTKVYFLTCIPALFLGVFVLWFRYNGKREQILLDVCVCLLCAGAVGGWWYGRNYLFYGTFSGLQETLHAPATEIAERLNAISQVPWTTVVKHLFVSYCWTSGWSFLQLPKPAYLVFVVLFGVCILGYVRLVLSLKRMRSLTSTERNGFLAAVFLTGFFSLGIAYHSINVYATMHVVGGSGGWYFYALVVPIGFLVALGLRELWPRCSSQIFLLLFGAVTVLELYAVLAMLIPYYTGIAIPTSGRWGLYFVENFGAVFSGQTVERLLENGPSTFSPPAVVLIGASWLGIQILVLWQVFASGPTARAEEFEESRIAEE